MGGGCRCGNEGGDTTWDEALDMASKVKARHGTKQAAWPGLACWAMWELRGEGCLGVGAKKQSTGG
jgi:hypothetical protein